MEPTQKDRVKFVYLVGKLLTWIEQQKLEVTFGDAYRNPKFSREQLGDNNSYFHEWSFHCKRCAIDLNLFRNGELVSRSEDYKAIGDFWKSLDKMCSWGGDFSHAPDGDHYSVLEGK